MLLDVGQSTPIREDRVNIAIGSIGPIVSSFWDGVKTRFGSFLLNKKV